MVVNFSHVEIELPKATVLGVAQEISATLIAEMNPPSNTGKCPKYKKGTGVHSVEKNEKFQTYVNGVLGHLNPAERAVMEPVLRKYRHVFHDETDNHFQGTDLIEHRIITGDAQPIRKAPYRTPFALRDEMSRQVKDMLRKGVIEPSSSPWSAPAILVPKKSADNSPKYRFCVDFRALNSVTQFDTYPLPVLEETLSTLHGSKYFSVIDCFSGFWQIKIAEEDRLKTAFSVPSGHYNFVRLPYGLSNSPSSFQRLMDCVLRDLVGLECYVFIDDVIIFSDTIEEHASRLNHVLERFASAKLQLQPSKCRFAQPQVEYLGYIVSADGIRATPEKTRAVEHFPVPRNQREVRQYLGLASFYRRLVPKFAQLAKPLTLLLRKDAPFTWGESEQAAFDALKTALCSNQVMAYPDFTQPFILTTDASKYAAAAILSQVQNGIERPLSYASRQMNIHEQNYSASEAEMCAVLWAVKYFRVYLYAKKFVLRTDHAALKYMHTFSDNNSRLLKWSLRLAEFDFRVEHRAGTQIRHVDALSRAIQSVTFDQSLSREEVIQEQRADEFCNLLKPGTHRGTTEYFTDEDDVIYRRRKNGEHQLVVPASLVERVIGMNHDPVTVAHPGRSRTLDLICLRFYWPKMRAHVEEYVRNCQECQRLKPRHKFRAPLGDHAEPTRPFELTSMDILGPFPISPAKNRYLLTFMDHLTSYAEAIPLPDITAPTVARAYVTHVIARHGAGSKLLTDQGRNFTSAFFRETCKILGITQLFTTAYNPRCNGKLENWHRSLCEGLSHYVNASGNSWDLLVPLYLMAYRNTPHGVNRYSPYYMLHGREMVIPSMQSLRAKLSPEIRDTDHAPRFENLKANMRRAHKLARQYSSQSHNANKQYYDRSAKHREFAVGDIVYLYNPVVKVGLSAKFRKPWVGPFKVVAKRSDLNYVIKNQQGKENVVHVNRLKKAHNPVKWEDVTPATKGHKAGKRGRPKRRHPEEEPEAEIPSTGPIPGGRPQAMNQTPERRTPDRNHRRRVDTPMPSSPSGEPRSNHRIDPNYVPPDTPTSRRELGGTRGSPPVTRYRARLHALNEVSDEAGPSH
jgi:transposase InsO family protein